MTPAFVPEEFEHTMGCTPGELLSWLPGALPTAALDTRVADDCTDARFEDGALRIEWRTLPPLRIALITLPRLQVRFRYSGLTPPRRREIQRRFDLATQRGGG